MNWAQSFGGFRLLNLGNSNEPAVTCANVILQTIISPPFCWNWNRGSVSFVVTAGMQDWAETVANFGFIEKASYTPAAVVTAVSITSNVATYTANNTFSQSDTVTVSGVSATIAGDIFNIVNQPFLSVSPTDFTVLLPHADVGTAAVTPTGVAVSGKVTEIPGVQNVLGSGNESGSPAFISPQLDNNQGIITFRMLPIPDQTYRINVIFQKRIPSLMTSPSSFWTPIPDHYSYIYQYGFLTLMLAYYMDARWASFSQKFMAALLGAAEGLEEEQKNIFEAAWLDMVSERQATTMKTSQGVSSRQI